MKGAKPITFTADNILGLLSYAYAEQHIPFKNALKDRCPKTTTRRICKPQPIVKLDKFEFNHFVIPGKPAPGFAWDYPLYKAGDILYVREPWRAPKKYDDLPPSELDPKQWLKRNGGLWYEADGAKPTKPVWEPGKYRHARYMPKWAARIYLQVATDSHIEPLQSITPVGAINEGYPGLTTRHLVTDYLDWFISIWDNIHGEGSWEENPYVWVTTFRIDKIINHGK